MRDRKEFETIYEEEDLDEEEEDDDDENYSSESPSLSSTLSPSPPTPLQNIAKAWSLATGIETDVVIHVQGQTFHLHKDPLISKSGYLKRLLLDFNEVTLTPPLQITAQTFSSIVDYCYTYQIVITPFNVASLRVAAELLTMTGDHGQSDNNLLSKTENYFCQAVSVNKEHATVVLRSCLELLPEAEPAAAMASKCIETLTSAEGGFENVNGWVNDVTTLTVEKFQLVADSLREQFYHNHDILYRLADLYLQEHAGKIREEEKTRMCNSVDCNKLSPNCVMHAIQNPRMPLRFVVRAMFLEQLNTRRTILSSTTTPAAPINRASIGHNEIECSPAFHHSDHSSNGAMTLGAILQRDAALRQTAQMKESMEATSLKIESLEKELMRMKKVLDSSKKKSEEEVANRRSASFRLTSDRKIGREESESRSKSLRFSHTDRRGVSSSSSSSEISLPAINVRMKTDKKFGWKFVSGLKNALRISSPKLKLDSRNMASSKVDEDNELSDVVDQEEDESVIAENVHHFVAHHRRRSFV